MAFRTQKISQMTPKGADLEATDLIEVSTIESGSYVTRSITGQELIDAIPAPTGFVPTSRTLTINGVAQDLSADRSWTIATGLTVGTTPISSGTIGRVLFQGTGNVLQQSSSLFWDGTNERLGIGTSTPARALDIVKTIASGAIEGVKIEVNHNSSTSAAILDFVHTQFDARARIQSIAGAGGANPTLSFIIRSTTAMSILQSGNVNIGNTTTDAGFRLDVNGTARFSDNLTIQGNQKRLILRETISGSTFFGIDFIASNASTIASILSNQSSGEIRNFVSSGGYFSTFYSNGSERMRIPTSGNLLINTTTDAGFRLDVNGTARVKGTGTTIGTTSFTVQDSASSDLFRVYDNGLVAIKAGVISLNGSNGSISGGFIASTGQIISGGTSITASAQMEVISTTRGFLPPRMTTTQRNAIASPAAGLVVYDTTLAKLCVYTTTWETITSL